MSYKLIFLSALGGGLQEPSHEAVLVRNQHVEFEHVHNFSFLYIPIVGSLKMQDIIGTELKRCNSRTVNILRIYAQRCVGAVADDDTHYAETCCGNHS